ncbi:hypothetical protein V7S43_002664 [Phytophthora oleae]|uniref:Uncharacterized protein n=1 Tax=Phytophthora oleae TaxID=2107226 RepID=A0ABD3G0K9_9STRA
MECFPLNSRKMWEVFMLHRRTGRGRRDLVHRNLGRWKEYKVLPGVTGNEPPGRAGAPAGRYFRRGREWDLSFIDNNASPSNSSSKRRKKSKHRSPSEATPNDLCQGHS